MGVKFYEIFRLTEWLKRNFNYLSIILPLDFSEILNIFEITVHLKFSRIWGCDVIKVLNHKPQKWQIFTW